MKFSVDRFVNNKYAVFRESNHGPGEPGSHTHKWAYQQDQTPLGGSGGAVPPSVILNSLRIVFFHSIRYDLKNVDEYA